MRAVRSIYLLVAAAGSGLAACGTGASDQARGRDGGASAHSSGATSSTVASSTPASSRTASSSSTSSAARGSASDAAAPDAASSDAGASSAPDAALPAACNGSRASPPGAPGPTPPAPNAAFTVPAGFLLETIAAIPGARELAALPNGDLLVADGDIHVVLVPDAEAAGLPGAPVVFTGISDPPVAGVAFAGPICSVLVGTQQGIYSIPYVDGQQSAIAGPPIAKVRQGTPTPGSDGDVHHTTSVAYAGGKIYAGVGSGCNACVEVDPTRATIQEMDPSGANLTTRATRIRNAIGLATNPETGTLWAGGAGQDNLPWGHPYEFFDAVTLHPGTADYGWPDCEENKHAYTAGVDCSSTVQPLVELPAYDTIIGATFYPAGASGAHAFPAGYRGGVFITAHGSWHNQSNQYILPRVVYVPMNGDAPLMAADWTDPTVQWGSTDFLGGFGNGPSYLGRPAGIAVGSQGSLFVADDANGLVYRVRPK